ncbi:MarR family transcriptional regulator [Arthrobacter sp. Br18]|uniref:MarR family winged helix-turn-helix transcriptional regulator n=1 Tax=Arthrobacter sp. Br18 TaxID=1312954 RepID=UPI0004791768|nr:MarR family transcriptional regulator [Arthrobacter sp. Br18]
MDQEQASAINAAIRTIGMRHRSLASTKLAGIGLSLGQEMLMTELAEKGPRSQAQLATAACCEPPTITSAVKKMEANGLVTRTPSPTDRRAIIVELTSKGEFLMADLDLLWRTLAEDTVAGLERTGLQDLTDTLTDLAHSLQQT